ncbi:hypothetical protein Plhal304r1_c046g0126791 [Plasmopara halstedii]
MATSALLSFINRTLNGRMHAISRNNLFSHYFTSESTITSTCDDLSQVD